MIGVGARAVSATEHQPEPQRGRQASWHTLDLQALDGHAERAAWVALSLVPGMGPAGFAAVLHRYGSARDALRARVRAR